MKTRLLSLWNKLTGSQRRMVVWGGGICIFITLLFLGNVAMNRSNAPPPTKDARKRPVDIEPKLIEKSQFMESQKEIAKRDDEITSLKKQRDDIAREKSGQAVAPAQPQTVSPAPLPGDQNSAPRASLPGPASMAGVPKTVTGKQSFPMPPPVPQGALALPPPPPGMAAGVQAGPPETEIGDITIVSPAGTTRQGKGEGEDKKKENGAGAVYLPPSFMEATLLSGLDAPTTSEAKGNPVPVLLRVKTPAVLPNSVKANLKGCFVIADGKGNLATERAELLLVSLSCLDRKGQAVVDQKIKGFVVDADGKIGLRGRVVAKMGSMIARSMLAGFFGGAGDAIKASATTTAISPLGTTQTVDPKDIAMSGVGSGLSSGFKEMQKFYMELARQTMPDVEVGATKPVTLVISEGVNLDIKKLTKGGGK